MFNNNTSQNEGPLLTVLGTSIYPEGKFSITEYIQIEYEVLAEINVDGKLIIETEALLKPMSTPRMPSSWDTAKETWLPRAM